MKKHYDPEFDSPEARANFATRHILNLHDRKRRRDELLEKFKKEREVERATARKASSFPHLLETLDVIQDATEARDKEKAFEAVTVLLLQFIDAFQSTGMMAQIFPLLEELKGLIQAEQYEEAFSLSGEIHSSLTSDD